MSTCPTHGHYQNVNGCPDHLADNRGPTPRPLAPLPARQFEYIESRLVNPAPALREAIDRLVEQGRDAQATRLTVALITLQNTTREVRYTLTEAQR